MSRSRLRRIPAMAAACAALLMAACSSSDSSAPPAAATLSSIAISPLTATPAVGATQALVVTGTFSDASTSNLTLASTFATSAAGVATVSGAGLVTAMAAGSATITATHTASGKTATATITVPGPTLNTIALTPATPSISVGGTQALTVTGTYSNASTANLTAGSTFATSAASIATVGAGGVITAVAAGSATITATHTASGKTATATVTVNAVIVNTGGLVFVDGFDAGVSFVDFGGATNSPATGVDATTLFNGRKSLKAVIPASNYGGGALVASATRNLSAFNALTFYAKASVANATLKVGIGNNAADVSFNAEAIGIPLTTTFTKYVIPLPNPAKFTTADGLFHYADGPNNYTVWFADVQYELLPAGQVGLPTGSVVNWPTVNVGVGSTFPIDPAPNTVNFAVPALPNGGKLTNVGFKWFTLTSSAPAVATVSSSGVVTGVSAGTASISAAMGAIAVSGSAPVTVTAPLQLPVTIAAAPTVLAANVKSLFTTVYTNLPVDTWQTSWSAGNSSLVDPYVVLGRNLKKYSLFNFVGVEFGLATPANTIDATTMTHIHVDVWSPNPSSNLEIQLVQQPGGAGQIIAKFQAGAIAANTWVGLEIPLSSFSPALTTRDQLRQLLFVAANPSVLYIDNLYFHK